LWPTPVIRTSTAVPMQSGGSVAHTACK
jgi:hypothetical protein